MQIISLANTDVMNQSDISMKKSYRFLLTENGIMDGPFVDEDLVRVSKEDY